VTIATRTRFLEAEIEVFRRQHGRSILKFRGIDSIAGIETYVGAEIRIQARDLPEIEEGRFYTFQLKGCRVFTGNGDYIGDVTDVVDSGGTEILKVDLGEEETLIPFAQSYLKKVDLDQRRIDVELPEGLRDLNR
jgi:16S rRNA processing protein RimM